MSLTEAVQIASMMSAESCRSTAYDGDADVMLRDVCRWRNTSHPQYLELAELMGIGTRFMAREFRRQADHESAKDCVARAFQAPGGATTASVAAHCHLSKGQVWVSMSRLRKEGMAIKRIREVRKIREIRYACSGGPKP